MANSALASVDFSKAEHHTVVIIGNGPAGLTAGIYAARAQLKPVIFRGDNSGGQLMITTDVENYPAFSGTGPDLVMKMEKQAEHSGATLAWGTVVEVDFSKRPFKLLVSPDKPVLADSVIIATGATAKYLNLPSEQKFMNQGVSACATCDGPLFRDKEVVVVGGGDSAAEEALFLTRLCPKVHLVHRRDKLRASQVMATRVLNNPRIQAHWWCEVEEVVGDQTVTGVRVRNNKTKESYVIPVSGMFLAIGHVPQTAPFKKYLDIDDQGYIKVKPGTTYTKVPGVFCCGDAQDHVYRQAITAAGTGCMAAIDCERWLAEHPL